MLSLLCALNLDIQIIVVSSGSTDNTNRIVSSYEGVELIVETKREGKCSAINKIIEHSRSDITILTDGDVRLDANSILLLLNYMRLTRARAVSGRVIPIPLKSDAFFNFARIACQAWDHLRQKELCSEAFVYPTGYLHAIQTDLLRHLHISKRIINDDAEIAKELYDLGIYYQYCRQAIVYVKFPDNFTDYFRQKVRTRLGRRLTSKPNLMKQIESALTSELISIVRGGGWDNAYYGVGLFLLDSASKFAALLKSKLPAKDAHLWSEITSTKRL